MPCLSLSSQAFLRLPYHKKYFIVIECFSFRDGMRILYRWGKRQVFISSDSMLCLSLSSQAFLRLPYHKKYFIVIECFSFRDGMRDFQSTWLL